MRNLYLKLLQKLCNIEVNRILASDENKQNTIGARKLIQYYTYVATECGYNPDPNALKVRNISLSTAHWLEFGLPRIVDIKMNNKVIKIKRR